MYVFRPLRAKLIDLKDENIFGEELFGLKKSHKKSCFGYEFLKQEAQNASKRVRF